MSEFKGIGLLTFGFIQTGILNNVFMRFSCTGSELIEFNIELCLYISFPEAFRPIHLVLGLFNIFHLVSSHNNI